MTAPAIWPVNLPLYGKVGATRGQRIENRNVFAPKSGTPIQRPLTSSAMERFSYRTIPLTAEELAVFYQFYEETIGQGTQWFAWVHPLTGDIRRVNIVGGEPATQDIDSIHTEVSFPLLVPSIAPSWAGMLSTANGYIQIVDATGWAAL